MSPAVEPLEHVLFQLAVLVERYRAAVERAYADPWTDELRTEFLASPPDSVWHFQGQVRNHACDVARSVGPNTPLRTAAGRLGEAAQGVGESLRSCWLDTPHQLRATAAARSEADAIGAGGMLRAMLDGSPLGPAGWAEYEAAAVAVGDAAAEVLRAVWRLGRRLGAACYPATPDVDGRTGGFRAYDEAYLLTEVSPAVTADLEAAREGVPGLAAVRPRFRPGVGARGEVVRVADEVAEALRNHRPPAPAAVPARVPASARRPAPPGLTPEDRAAYRRVRTALKADDFAGDSDAVLGLFRTLSQNVLAGHRAVLLEGPSGTGKTTLAEAYHTAWGYPDWQSVLDWARRGPRAGDAPLASDRPFERWQASRSSASDATGPRAEWVGIAPGSGYPNIPKDGTSGLLQRAHGGTVFVDEVADLELALQTFLLDATEGREVTPLGGSKPHKPDVRFVFATNKPVEGTLRTDLLARIPARVGLPTLAERGADIVPLARKILGPSGPLPDACGWLLLLGYDWPYNVRELENVLRCAVGKAKEGDTSRDLKVLSCDLLAACLPPGSAHIPGGDGSADAELIDRMEQLFWPERGGGGSAPPGLYKRIADALDWHPSKVSRSRRRPGRNGEAGPGCNRPVR